MPSFHLKFSDVKFFWKHRVWQSFGRFVFAFRQIFHTRKLGEITVFCAVKNTRIRFVGSSEFALLTLFLSTYLDPGQKSMMQ